MRTLYLGLKDSARQFYETWHATRCDTRRAFASTGTAALARIILAEDGLKALPAGRRPEVLALGGVARAGWGLITPQVLSVVRELLSETQVFTWAIGASRPKDPGMDPASIYFHTLDTLKEQIETAGGDWNRVALIATEYGLATASTLEAVVPAITRELPNLNPANVVFFANCACLRQSGARIERAFPEGLLAVGSEWMYSEKLSTRFYLNTMLSPNGSDEPPWETTPRDWGECCFGGGQPDDVNEFLQFLNQTVKLTPNQKAQAREHLLKKE